MSAKVDNAAVQDGYHLYLYHAVFFDEKGNWSVAQQGMNSEIKIARRCHWISDNFGGTFLFEPRSGIVCDHVHQNVLDMTSCDSTETQKVSRSGKRIS